TPTPGFNNMVIEAGNTSIDDMIKDTKRGILIYGVIGGGQSNVLAGDFSVNVGLGFLIDNGEIVGRVKDTMVAGNFYELFRDGRFMLSKEQQVIANYKLPYAYVEDVTVATKS
ncbi:TldD/PmbA family protein, partial [candidate division WOR-3 bacterium]|nr:TldD/PmbA family protein [candidate division WOR-3 bacterium]